MFAIPGTTQDFSVRAHQTGCYMPKNTGEVMLVSLVEQCHISYNKVFTNRALLTLNAA